MKIYKLRADSNNYLNLTVTNRESWDVLRTFNGEKRTQAWLPIGVEYILEDSLGMERPKGDFPSLSSHVPVFSAHAIERLADSIRDFGELLPLECAAGPLFAFNVTRVLDALVEEESEITRFSSSGKIMNVERHFFLSDAVRDQLIFKIVQTPLMDVFVSREFVELVNQKHLAGFCFEEIWSDRQ